MTTDDSEGRRPEQQPQLTVRVPRLGIWAAGGLSFLMAASLIVVAPVGIFVAPLALVPVVQWVATDRRNGLITWGWVILALVAVSVTGTSFLGAPAWTYLAAYALVVALPAASLDLWRQTGISEAQWIDTTVLAGTAGTLTVIAAAAWPRPPLEALAAWFYETTAFIEESYRSVGVSTGELELAFDAVEILVPWITPSVPVAYLVLVVFWIRPRLPILGFPAPVAAFEEYRNDDWLAAGFALAGLGTLFLAGTPRWIAVNVLIAVLILYFVQGLAMIRAHLARWLGKGWLVRWGVALLCLQGPLPLVVAALGIADGFFELRPRTGDDGGKNEADTE